MTDKEKLEKIAELCRDRKKHDPLVCSTNFGEECDCKADGWNWLRSKINQILSK